MIKHPTIVTLTLGLALLAPVHVALSDGQVALSDRLAKSFVAPETTATTTHCFTDWAEAGDVIRRESLVSVSVLHAQAKQRHLGDVVRVTLCSSVGQFTYKLLLREPKGSVKTLIVSAVRPFEP
ncbi:MAG: hypothetical protein ABL898_04690 [Hyphomicrobiaceae bacterium]